MPQTTRFPVALHILITLTLRPDEWMNSASLAWSVNTNASMIRRILSSLSGAGLVISQAGVAGGAKLAVDPGEITLLDVYRAVDLKRTVRVHDANTECPLGSVIDRPLQAVLDEANDATEQVLADRSVLQLAREASRLVLQRSGARGGRKKGRKKRARRP